MIYSTCYRFDTDAGILEKGGLQPRSKTVHSFFCFQLMTGFFFPDLTEQWIFFLGWTYAHLQVTCGVLPLPVETLQTNEHFILPKLPPQSHQLTKANTHICTLLYFQFLTGTEHDQSCNYTCASPAIWICHWLLSDGCITMWENKWEISCWVNQ